MSNQMTPVGVPSELVFNLPASMLDSRKIEQRIQPYNTNKYVPMWNSDINIEMTINSISNYLQSVTDTKATPDATFVISDLELVFDSIELSPESFSMVMANYPQKVVIKTSTYLGGYTNSFSGSGGQDLPINARLSSLKALYCYFNQAALSDKTFGGVNPNGQDIVFITNGQYYPQRPIKLNNPSEVYMQQQKAFGSIKSYSHSGSASKNNLCRRINADSDGLYSDPVNEPTTLSDLLTESNQFYLAIDTEIINTNKDSLYNGIQTGVNSNIRLNIQNAITNSTTCYYWCYYDALIEMDFTTGITRAIY